MLDDDLFYEPVSFTQSLLINNYHRRIFRQSSHTHITQVMGGEDSHAEEKTSVYWKLIESQDEMRRSHVIEREMALARARASELKVEHLSRSLRDRGKLQKRSNWDTDLHSESEGRWIIKAHPLFCILIMSLHVFVLQDKSKLSLSPSSVNWLKVKQH